MKVAVTVKHHDHEPHIEYVDTNKLNKDDYVDMELLKAINAEEEHCWIDASDWEDYPEKFPDDDIGISAKANIKRPKKIDYAIMLTIDFDC